MKNQEAKNWLDFAKRDLEAAKLLYEFGDIPNALYHLQQSAEKSLKSVIIYQSIPLTPKQFRTHSLEYLCNVLEDYKVDIPEELKDISTLTAYAFTTRYPDDYIPVSEEEYEQAYEIALKVYEWAKSIVEN